MENITKEIIGRTIVTHGQTVKVIDIWEEAGDRIYLELEHPVVVPGPEYTRDIIKAEEVQKVVPE